MPPTSRARGALKELGALVQVPVGRRWSLVRQAVDQGVAFLVSKDPAVADSPMGWGNTRPSASWFKPGSPSGYVADVLQTLEVLAELAHGRDPATPAPGLAWLESGQNRQGRWRNRSASDHKTWVDIERQGQPSKWVTLRASTVLRAADR